jgi:tellurite resistance protein TerC
VLWWGWGGAAAGEYYAGFLIEKSLSVDNVFVWALLFSFFAVPPAYQHRVLFWGIFGALVLRAIFIFAGVALIEHFEPVLFVFGAFLVFTALRLLRHDEAEVHPDRNPALRLVRRVVPSTDRYHGQHLFTHEGGRRLATPLFAVLIMIETTDVVFAVDSIPAILAVSREQYLVFSSNAFAILGLRALYFLLQGAHAKFTYLQPGLAVILAFVGVKMIASHWYHVPTGLSLLVIALVLAGAVGLSLLRPPPEEEDGPAPGGGSDAEPEAPPAALG